LKVLRVFKGFEGFDRKSLRGFPEISKGFFEVFRVPPPPCTALCLTTMFDDVRKTEIELWYNRASIIITPHPPYDRDLGRPVSGDTPILLDLTLEHCLELFNMFNRDRRKGTKLSCGRGGHP
jgi:hypothetical protein